MSQVDPELLSCFVDEAPDLLAKWEEVCLELSRQPSQEGWNALFRVAHNLKGTSRSVGLDSIGAFVHQVEDLITQAKQGAIPSTPELFRALLAAQSALSQWTLAVRSDPGVSFVPPELSVEREAPPAPLPPEAPAAAGVDSLLSAVNSASPRKDSEVSSRKSATAPRSPSLDETVRVSAKKLDQLIQMVGELSIQQSIITHQAARERSEKANESQQQASYVLKKMTRDLYERALALRMQPVQPIFQRLERTLSEIAQTLGKKVQVELVGGEVELDKTVCEKMIEPLTHMVRNSVDHGIESAEVRAQLGKPEVGRVKIQAIQETSSVALVIEDDGKGLHAEKILSKAKEKGLITEGTRLTQSEVFSLIFLPGFSTADQVTDVSGRGVGMDVVMKAIESLRGSVMIASDPGRGTRFTIRLPTSLALIDALLFELSGVEYAVALDCVEEVIDLVGVEVNNHMLRLRDRVLPVVALDHYLQRRAQNRVRPPRKALIVRQGKRRVAFQVDEIGEQQQIVVRKLNDALSSVQGISGGTILSSGEPGLIVDLEALARKYLNSVQPEEEVA